MIWVSVFSTALLYNVSEAISREVRAYYNDDIRHQKYGEHGLSCFAPVINIARHPLWGRIQVGWQFRYVQLLSYLNVKRALYRIKILCQRYTFWSYPAGLTIADPPG